jgi:hypothetical protein
MYRILDDDETARLMDRYMRAAVQEHFPELYPMLAEKYPELYGPDSLAKIKRDYPDLFPASKEQA